MSKKLIFISIFLLVILILVVFQRHVNSPIYEVIKDTIWSVEFFDDQLVAQPVYYNGKLYVQTLWNFYAFDAITGNTFWKVAVPQFELSDIYFDDLLIVPSDSYIVAQLDANTISAFDARSGNNLWTSNHIPAVNELSNTSGVSIYDITIAGNLVIVSRWNNAIAAYDLDSGSLVWSNPVSTRTILTLMPYKDLVLLGTLDKIQSFDLKNGIEQQNFFLTGDSQGYFIENNIIYIAFDNGKCSVAALDLFTFTYKWCVSPFDAFYFSHPIVFAHDNDNLYLVADKILAVSKKDGLPKWSAKNNNNFENAYIHDSFLYLANLEFVSKISANDGAEVSRISVKRLSDSVWPPIFAQDLIYIFTPTNISVYKN